MEPSARMLFLRQMFVKRVPCTGGTHVAGKLWAGKDSSPEMRKIYRSLHMPMYDST